MLPTGLVAQERPLPGSRPGTERWIVWLRDRAYNLQPQLQWVRAGATRAERTTRAAQLEQLAATDQREIATLVAANGGAVEKHFWVLSAASVEVPPGALGALRAHPRVRRLVPVRARGAAEVASAIVPAGPVAPPIATSTDSNNHNVGAARALIGAVLEGNANRGGGVRIAFFDSGIDADSSGVNATGTPHPSFVEQANPSVSRIDVHLRAGLPGGNAIDCNNVSASGSIPFSPPFAYRPCWHSTSALHGTAMAGIACGNAFSAIPDGHAPDARIADVSVTVVPAPTVQDISRIWTTDEATMLNAIEMLRVDVGSLPVHVLNISFAGWSDPADPVPTALDVMALEDDVLVVASCGNAADETRLSHGFYNGLAVGAVHARVTASEPFVAMPETSRGPLASNFDRFYPDVCATGAGPGDPFALPRFQYGPATDPIASQAFLQMPMVDVGDPCSIAGGAAGGQGCVSVGCPSSNLTPQFLPVPAGIVRFGRGTSEAAAQVSGAAALYRAARPTATAEETRAAIVLNVIGAYPGAYAGGTGHEQHAYASRNTFGLGYVRDDVLAEFAVRLSAIKPLHQVVLLTPTTTTTTVSYSGLTPGKRYAVAVCWPRLDFDDVEVGFANVDLEVLNGSSVIARSASLGNNYERVTLVAPGGTLSIRVQLSTVPSWLQTLAVQVVGREFEPDLDTVAPGFQPTPVHAASGIVETLDPGMNCTNAARDLRPVRRIPLDYEFAYGSGALNLQPLNPTNLQGPFHLGGTLATSATNGPGGSSIHIEISGLAVTGGEFPLPLGHVGAPLSIGGIAFRTWRPFSVTGPLEVEWVKVETTGAAAVTTGSPPNPGSLQLGPTSAAVTVVGSQVVTLPGVSADWVARGFAEHPVVLPFATPFAYSNGNLHIWIRWRGTIPSTYMVDFAGDAGETGYGYLIARGGPGLPIGAAGVCPLLALLPDPATVITGPPTLRVFGEPLVGRSLEVQVLHTGPSQSVVLALGNWLPGSGLVGPCAVHIDMSAPILPFFGTTNAAGMERFNVPFTLSASLLHAVFGMQAQLAPPSGLLTNGVKVTLGGGL